jgi:hypothetical protein
MGLDIGVDCPRGRSTRVGTYGYVHILRKNCIVWTLQLIQKTMQSLSPDACEDSPDLEDLHKAPAEFPTADLGKEAIACEPVETSVERINEEDEEEEDDDEDAEERRREWERLNRTQACLRTWLEGESRALGYSGQISYINMSTTPDEVQFALAQHKLLGLFWFVNHSDCDGGWSLGQVIDISLWMHALLDANLDHKADNDHQVEKGRGLGQELGKLVQVFDEAASQQSLVRCY